MEDPRLRDGDKSDDTADEQDRACDSPRRQRRQRRRGKRPYQVSESRAARREVR